jgi:hypothetical protein
MTAEQIPVSDGRGGGGEAVWRTSKRSMRTGLALAMCADDCARTTAIARLLSAAAQGGRGKNPRPRRAERHPGQGLDRSCPFMNIDCCGRPVSQRRGRGQRSLIFSVSLCPRPMHPCAPGADGIISKNSAEYPRSSARPLLLTPVRAKCMRQSGCIVRRTHRQC